MTFISFVIFLALAAFVLWNIWIVMRSIGETGQDDSWGD